MNNPNPFIPQGSWLEQKNKKRANFKVAVFSIFGFTALLMSFFLIQGCKKEASGDTASTDMTNTPANTPDTNPLPPLLPPPSNTLATTGSNTTPLQAPVPVPAPIPVPAPVPAPEPAGKEYTVVKGDSFYSIAKKCGVKMKEVVAANPSIPPTKLKVGMKIQIPAGGTSSVGGTPAMSDTSGGAGDVYTVKSGDSLTKIAKSFSTSVKALRAANGLKTDKIKVGQKLKVPEKTAVAEASAPPPAASLATGAPAPAPVPPAPSGAPAH